MYFHAVKSTAHPPIIGLLGHSTDFIVKQPKTATIRIDLYSCSLILCCSKRNSGLMQKLHVQTIKYTLHPLSARWCHLGNKNYSFMFFSLFVKIFKPKLKSVMQVLDITLLGLRPRVGIKLWAPLGLHIEFIPKTDTSPQTVVSRMSPLGVAQWTIEFSPKSDPLPQTVTQWMSPLRVAQWKIEFTPKSDQLPQTVTQQMSPLGVAQWKIVIAYFRGPVPQTVTQQIAHLG